jgi:hypothetical protein
MDRDLPDPDERLGALDERAIVGLLEACRGAREDACPESWRRAACDLFLGRPEGEGLLLDVIYDSSRPFDSSPVGAAVRGLTPAPARTIRFGNEEVALDMQVRRASDGAPVLFVALQPPRQGLELVILVKPQETQRRAVFDGTGTAQVRLPARADCFTGSVRGAAGEMYRIGTTPIDPAPDPT